MHRPSIPRKGVVAFALPAGGALVLPALRGAGSRSGAFGFLPLVSLVFLPPASAGELFRDVTSRTGIDFVHTCGSAEKDWIVEVNGSGVVLLDHDGDGDPDVYFVNGSRFGRPADEPPPRNALYRNDGGWRFTDVTTRAGVGDEGWGSGAAVADIDNDGHLDLYVTNLGPNVLYRNRGDGTFGLLEASGAEDPRWSIGASFADFDRDGLVDLYVANYIEFRRDAAKRRGASECTYTAH